jgi:hypothetical protein
VLLGGRMLELPLAWAYPVIVAVETAVALSIAVTLAALFIGARPGGPAVEGE